MRYGVLGAGSDVAIVGKRRRPLAATLDGVRPTTPSVHGTGMTLLFHGHDRGASAQSPQGERKAIVDVTTENRQPRQDEFELSVAERALATTNPLALDGA